MGPSAKKKTNIKMESSDESEHMDSKLSSGQFGRVNRIILDKNSDEYKKRRERNNIAVKKSRNKSKQKTQETIQRVSELRAENERLENKVSILHKELSFLKDLFLAHTGSAHAGQLDLNLTNDINNENGPNNSNVISTKKSSKK